MANDYPHSKILFGMKSTLVSPKSSIETFDSTDVTACFWGCSLSVHFLRRTIRDRPLERSLRLRSSFTSTLILCAGSPLLTLVYSKIDPRASVFPWRTDTMHPENPRSTLRSVRSIENCLLHGNTKIGWLINWSLPR